MSHHVPPSTARLEVLLVDLPPGDSALPGKPPLPFAASTHRIFLQAPAPELGSKDDSTVTKIFPGTGPSDRAEA